MSEGIKVLFLGTRGSVPVSRKDSCKYGGATACVLISLENFHIVLDTGSGLLEAEKCLGDVSRPVYVLISHPHIDHLIGFPACPFLFEGGRPVKVFGKKRQGLGIKDQIGRLMSPPLWPITVDSLPSTVSFRNIDGPFVIGSGKDCSVGVNMMDACHPGCSTVFRIEIGSKNIVYATDFECDGISEFELAEFSRGADLLIMDAQYTEEDYERKKGWGHSTIAAAAAVAKNSGAKCTRLFHHDPSRTDARLDELGSDLPPDITFARDGEAIIL